MIMDAAGGDAGVAHPVQRVEIVWSMVWMLLLVLLWSLRNVAKGVKVSAPLKSFVNFWMIAYLVLLAVSMSITTAMALEQNQSRCIRRISTS